MTRAVIYARYSTDMQSASSIEDQIRITEALALREGCQIVNRYTDYAMSGASMLRPGIQALMNDAAAGKFDVVIAEALDRLSRDQEDVAGIYKRLQFSDIKIQTVAEGEISSLHIGLKGTMNAMFLQDLAKKTHRGLHGRVESGKSAGGNAYGYEVIKKFDSNGQPLRGDRQIDPAQAAIVNRIFREYLSGKSPKAIAHQLNKEGIPGPASEGWGPSTINGNKERGTGILNNDLYIGMLVWNRLSYRKDPETGKRVSRLNPESEWIRKEVPELRIIDQALWDGVKEKQGAIRKHSSDFREMRRPQYLFSFLIKCGLCDGGCSKVRQDRYGCSTAHNKGTCSNRLSIQQELLERSILGALQSHLMDPQLCKIFCEEYTRHVNELRRYHNAALGYHNAALEGYRAELGKLEKARVRIIKAVIDGFAGDEMKIELDRIVERRKTLEELLNTTNEAPILLHPNMAQHYRNEIDNLILALNQGGHRSEAAQLIRGLVDKIVLTPKKDTQTLRVDLHGDLAGILSMATKAKKPFTKEDALIYQVTLVTGGLRAKNLVGLYGCGGRI